MVVVVLADAAASADAADCCDDRRCGGRHAHDAYNDARYDKHDAVPDDAERQAVMADAAVRADAVAAARMHTYLITGTNKRI